MRHQEQDIGRIIANALHPKRRLKTLFLVHTYISYTPHIRIGVRVSNKIKTTRMKNGKSKIEGECEN